MALWEEFKEKVLATDGSFDMVDSGKSCDMYYHFIQSKIGVARYVYGCNSMDEDYCLSIDAKYKLVGIISDFDDTIYVVSTYFFMSEHGKDLPEGMKFFDSYVKELNEQVIESVFPKFMENLSVNSDDYLKECALERCRIDARRAILCGKTVEEEIALFKPQTLISHDEAAKILCGYDTAREIAMENLTKNQRTWASRKLEIMKINELITNQGETVTPCELAIGEALRSLDRKVKTVTVEFDVNGKTAAGKINPETILNRLINGYGFNNCDFANYKQGKEIMSNLEIDFDNRRNLVATDISKITYGKKVLYEKK